MGLKSVFQELFKQKVDSDVENGRVWTITAREPGFLLGVVLHVRAAMARRWKDGSLNAMAEIVLRAGV